MNLTSQKWSISPTHIESSNKRPWNYSPSLEEGEIQEETHEPIDSNVVEDKCKCFASWKACKSQANNIYTYSLAQNISIIHNIKVVLIAQHEHDDSIMLIKACRHSNWQNWEDIMKEEIWHSKRN